MNDYAKKEKNSLYLNLDCINGCSGTIELNSEIICQTITVKAIRTHFDSQADQNNAANQRLHLKLDHIFGPQQLNNNINLAVIPIFHDSTIHDSTFYPNISISMSKKIPKKVKWSIVNYDNTAITANVLNFIQVLIEYEMDKI